MSRPSVGAIVVILFALSILGLVAAAFIIVPRQRKKLKNHVMSIPGLNVSLCFVDHNSVGYGLDDENGVLCLSKWNDKKSLAKGGPEFLDDVISYKDIVSAEILCSGDTVTRVNRGSQALAAIAGGVLAGGVGVVIGALSGSSRTQRKSDVNLQIIVDRGKASRITIPLVLGKVKEGTPEFNKAMEQARDWLAVLSSFIRRADNENQTRSNASAGKTELKRSIADEIGKLLILKRHGAITEDEFVKLKGKLLNGFAEA